MLGWGSWSAEQEGQYGARRDTTKRVLTPEIKSMYIYLPITLFHPDQTHTLTSGAVAKLDINNNEDNNDQKGLPVSSFYLSSRTQRRFGCLTTINILEELNENKMSVPFVLSSTFSSLSTV